MTEYNFSISYLRSSVYETCEFVASFPSKDAAYSHFRKLLKQFGVDGKSYYLCSWGLRP